MLVWILGVLTVLGLLLSILRIGIRITLHRANTTVDVSVGPFRFRVFPRKAKADPPVQDIPPKTIPMLHKKIGLGRPSVAEIRDLIGTLSPPLKRALVRTRRSIRVDPLQISVTVGGEEDPAESAQLYGELHGVVWTVMPTLEQLLKIKDPYVHIGIDFDAQETTVEGTLGVSIRVGTILGIAWSLGVPAIRWLLAFQKRHKKTQQMPPVSVTDTAN